MQQDKNIETKLRELDNLEQADLNHIEDHWTQMHALLPPPAVPSTGGAPAGFTGITYTGLAMALAASFIYFSGILTNTETMPAVTPHAVTNLRYDFDTTLNKPALSQTLTAPRKAGVLVGKKELQIMNPTILSSKKLSNNDVAHWHIIDTMASNSIARNTATLNLPVFSRQQQLISFLSGLEKEKQAFTITNERDTFLTGKEGTVIYIPAHSFNKAGQIKIELGEYYSYSDMVLNRLTTTSTGQQLISGGMFQLEAKSGTGNVSLQPGRKLTAYIPGITEKDSFSIFNGYINNNTETLNKVSDWELSGVKLNAPVSKMFIKAIDLTDDIIPFETTFGSKRKAVFFRSGKSALSRRELKEALQKKYGDVYDIIKVRNFWERRFFRVNGWSTMGYSEYGKRYCNQFGIGDTADFTPAEMRIYKLTPIDTVYKFINQAYESFPVQHISMVAATGEKYSIKLDRLGWINCDRFNKTRAPRNDYVVDLNDSAQNYFTVLLFKKYKSILAGRVTSGNKVVFDNIPAKEHFQIISIGINNKGKAVYAIKQGPFKSSLIDGLQFEPASAPVLKTALSNFD